MSDRLLELLRQRAAIQAHLAWLDREIAQARPADSLTAANIPLASVPEIAPTPVTPVSAPDPVSTAPDPDAILAGYRQNTNDLRVDVRKGCLLYFFGAFALLGFAVALFYFVNRLNRSHSDPTPSEQRTTPTP